MGPAPRPSPLRRVNDALLSISPPRWLSLPAFVLYGVVWLAMFAPVTLRTREFSIMRLQLQQDAAGVWRPPPVPAAVATIDVELAVEHIASPLLDRLSITPTIHPATVPPLTLAQLVAAWTDRVNAGDVTSATVTGHPLSAARQIEVLGIFPPSPGGIPVSVILTKPAPRRVAFILWNAVPVFFFAAAIVVGVARFNRRRHVRRTLDQLARGICPGCRYERGAMGASAPCPECGTRPEQFIHALTLLGARVPTSAPQTPPPETPLPAN